MDATLSALAALYADDLLYSDVSWLTSHNAFSIYQEGWSVHPQQHCTIKEQYEFGVFAFMIDVYEDSQTNKLVLRHGGESIPGIHKPSTGEAFFDNFLTTINQILSNDTKAIITLHVENYVTNLQIANAVNSAINATNLLSTDPNDASLTLGKMRAHNQRLVVFSDRSDDANGIYGPSYYKETSYSLGSDKYCNDRLESRASFDSDKEIFILNHFYSTSCANNNQRFLADVVSDSLAKIDCGIVNSRDEIKNRIELCLKQGLFPNFVAVDFVEQGNYGGAREAVFELNKISKIFALNNQTLSPITYSSHLPSNYTSTEAARNVFFNVIFSPHTILGLGLGMLLMSCFCKCYYIPKNYVHRTKLGKMS